MCEEPEEPSGTPSQPVHRSWDLWAVTLEKLNSARSRGPGYGSFLKRSWGNCSLALDSKLEDPAKIHSHSEHSKPVRQDMSTCPRVWVKLVTQLLLNNTPVRIDNCWSKDIWWRESFALSHLGERSQGSTPSWGAVNSRQAIGKDSLFLWGWPQLGCQGLRK